MKVWLIEILLKKCDMNKCDPFYREDLKRGHIFWCHTFWGGELAVGRVVWVLGMVGVEVSRCVWQGITFFGVALFGVGGGADGGWGWGCGRGLMGFGVVCLWIYCLEVFAIGVTLFWSHFFVQIFYEYIVWKGFAVGGSHFLMSHYIEFMSFIELANLLNSWTYGPINNNNNKTRVSC